MWCAPLAIAQTEIQMWHSMKGALNDKVNEIATKFNATQKDYKIVPVFKGEYPESMTAAIAAYRAGNAPHILQVFEVGTATMMAAKGAIVPVATLMKDADEPFDPNAYLPAVAGYYTDSKGDEVSLQQLTQERARQLSERFQAAGVDASRVQANGMGAANPLAANSTLSGRAKNRRTEITFTVQPASVSSRQ